MINGNKCYINSVAKLKKALQLGFSCYEDGMGPFGEKTMETSGFDYSNAFITINRDEKYYYQYNEQSWIAMLIEEGIFDSADEYRDDPQEYFFLTEEDWDESNAITFDEETSQIQSNWEDFDMWAGNIYFDIDNEDERSLEEFGLRKVWVEDEE